VITVQTFDIISDTENMSPVKKANPKKRTRTEKKAVNQARTANFFAIYGITAS
jgi:hypothetical protein